MKTIDLVKLNKYIELNKESIEWVDTGMYDDFWWSRIQYYHYCNKFAKDIIGSTYWSTPIALVKFKEGKIIVIDCFTDDGIDRENEFSTFIEVFKSDERTKKATKKISTLERYNIDDLLEIKDE